MINGSTLAKFEPLGSRLLKPIYNDYSFGNIPNTIQFLLTDENPGRILPADCFGGAYPQVKKIVLFFIDSFGWQFWRRYGERFRTTRSVMERGTMTPISALFPTTTAASVSTMNLGVLPSAHGVYEWNMYVPAFGQTIQSLPFMPLGGHPGECEEKGHDIRQLLMVHETVHQRLARRDVSSIQIAHTSYARSPYNRIASAGADMRRHATLPEALVLLKDALLTTSGKALISLYWAGLDTIAHIYGPGTPFHEAEIVSFWATFDALLADVRRDDTLFLFTADHGHVYADAAETVYINERWPELNGWLLQSSSGHKILPNGSPRDVFLHIDPAHRAEALSLLEDGLGEIALVLDMDAAISEGLFGGPLAGTELRRRIGDILILPFEGHFVWWRERGLMSNSYYGHHGGLSAAELVTVLGATHEL